MPGGFNNPGQVVFDLIGKYDPTAPQQLEAALSLLQQKMDALTQSMLANGRSAAAVAQAMMPLAQQAASLQGMLDATRNSFGLTASQAMGAASAVQGLARGFEDVVLTGGRMSSAINNVPQFIEGVGRAAGLSNTQIFGLSSAATLLSSALFIAIDNWSTLMRAMGTGGARTEAEELKELGKQTEKTADELDRYLKLKEREQELQRQASGKTEAEAAQRKAVDDALADVDQGKVWKALADTAPDVMASTDPAARAATDAVAARRESLRTGRTFGGVAYRRSDEEYREALATDPGLLRLLEEQRKAIDQAARNLTRDAALDPDKLRGLINTVGRTPAAFPAGFADRLSAATPEGQRAAKDLEAELGATEKAVADRLHGMVRAAHDAVGDPDGEPGDRAAAVRGILADLGRSGMVGEGARRTREQLEDMAAGADRDAARQRDAAATDAEGADASNLAAFHRRGQERMEGYRRRIADVTMTKEGDPLDRQRALKAILDEAEAHRVALRDKDMADLHAAVERASRQVGGQADAGRKAEANRLDDPFLKKLESEMARNRLGVAQGLPVARSAAEAQRLHAAGENFSLSDDLLAEWQRQRVGNDLRAGGRNPALAGRIVENARKGFEEQLVGAASRTATTGDRVMDNQIVLGNLAAALAEQAARGEARAEAIGRQLRTVQGVMRRSHPMRPGSTVATGTPPYAESM